MKKIKEILSMVAGLGAIPIIIMLAKAGILEEPVDILYKYVLGWMIGLEVPVLIVLFALSFIVTKPYGRSMSNWNDGIK